MKSMLKASGVALLAALALVSFMSVSSAAAKTGCEQETKLGTHKYRLCIEGKEVVSGHAVVPFAPTGKIGHAFISMPVGWGDSVECTGARAGEGGVFDTSLGKIESGKNIQVNELRPYFTGCHFTSSVYAKKCHVASEIPFVKESGVFGTGVEAMTGQSEEGSRLLSVSITQGPEGNCPPLFTIPGIRTVYTTNPYQCKLPSFGIEGVEHEISCEAQVNFGNPEESWPLTYSLGVKLTGTEAGKKFSLFESF